MAAALAQRLLGPSADVKSAGLDAEEDAPASAHAKAVLDAYGIDLSGHRARSFDSFDHRAFGVVIAMTPAIARELAARGVPASRLVTFSICDPYGRGLEAYRATCELIESQLRQLFGACPGGSTEE
jgi:protein-tyrosine-phosphatase